MIGKVQTEFLESLVGPPAPETEKEEAFAGGIYYQGVVENESIDFGTRVLYLKRAIQQNCSEFNESLDKLYRPGLKDKEKEKNDELIDSLKRINDLCFNNEVKYEPVKGEPKHKSALDHFFGGLPRERDEAGKLVPLIPEEFKAIIVKSIDEGIKNFQCYLVS